MITSPGRTAGVVNSPGVLPPGRRITQSVRRGQGHELVPMVGKAGDLMPAWPPPHEPGEAIRRDVDRPARWRRGAAAGGGRRAPAARPRRTGSRSRLGSQARAGPPEKASASRPVVRWPWPPARTRAGSSRIRAGPGCAARCPWRSGTVLTAGAAAVAQLKLGELGVDGEGGEPVAIDVGEAQLRAGVRAFLADDHPHPRWPAR
jgi:hypothetical protein